MEKAARIGKPLSCGRVRFLMAAFAAVMMAVSRCYNHTRGDAEHYADIDEHFRQSCERRCCDRVFTGRMGRLSAGWRL